MHIAMLCMSGKMRADVVFIIVYRRITMITMAITTMMLGAVMMGVYLFARDGSEDITTIFFTCIAAIVVNIQAPYTK